MAKFNNVKTNIGEVAQKEAMTAQKMVVEKLLIADLIPDPENGEDVTVTEDLEDSIRAVGFIEPITVTQFGCEDGKYRIVSGHRRVEAMKKLGEVAISAFVEKFETEQQVVDARQRMNLATRDSAKDPLLYVRRFAMFESNRKGWKKGDIAEAFAKATGMSKSTVERYRSMASVVDKIQHMVVDDLVGFSSVLPLAPLSEAEQNDIYNIFQDALNDGAELTRPLVKEIVDSYKNGLTTWDEIKGAKASANNGFAGAMNEPIDEEEAGESVGGGDDENAPHAEENEEEWNGEAGGFAGGAGDGEDDNSSESDNPVEQKEIKRGKAILATLNKLDSLISEQFTFEDDESSVVAVNAMMNLCANLIHEANNVAIECVDGGWEMFMAGRKVVNEAMEITKE